MKNKRIVFFVTLLFILYWPSQSFPLKKPTHRAINQHIAQNTVNSFSLNDYLMNNLGFEKGANEELIINSEKKKVFQWFGEGGWMEDVPVWRAFRHFHNPLEPWDSAGLKGSTLGRSSIIWAQSLDQSYGNYAWQDVRNYFYLALTSLDKTTRESYFAETFRGLGQQMHLVEDASVIMHARDDIHIFYSYETWVEDFRNEEGGTFGTWLANAITYDNSILNLSPNPLAPIPIARIIDTDSYDGTNPDITSGLNIGISEYTNANFFSDDTINSSDFPYPDIDQTTVIERAAPSGNYQRQYYLKNCCGETNGGQGYLLAAVDYLDYYRQQYPLLSFALPIIPVLDNNVYADYAPLLIPRAVGYSAGLLDYFFRGEIEITPPDSGVYAIDETGTGFTSITLLAENITPDAEDMTDGSIELVVKYKLALEDPFQSKELLISDEFSYIVVPEANNIRSIPINTTVELTFDLSSNPIPLWAVDVYLQVVYKGTLGNENDAVAVGFKDISEPTPIDLFSNTDKICLYDAWYDAGSPEAIEQVDVNGDGIAYGQDEYDVYPHDQQDIYIKFTRIDNPQYAYPSDYDSYVSYLTAGNLSRKPYILSDYGSYDKFYYSMYTSWVVKDANDLWTHLDTQAIYYGYAIKNQTDYVEDSGLCGGPPSCYIRIYPGYDSSYPGFYTIRGVDMWWGTGLIYINEPYPVGSACSNNLL